MKKSLNCRGQLVNQHSTTTTQMLIVALFSFDPFDKKVTDYFMLPQKVYKMHLESKMPKC